MTRMSERRAGLALLAATLAIIITMIVYAWMHRAEEVTRGDDRCPIDPAYLKSSTVVLADWTDRFTPAQQVEIKGSTLRLADKMNRDEGLSLHIITGKPEDAAKPFGFSRCKEVDPKAVNWLTQTAKFVRQDNEREFERPLRAALDEFVKGGEASESPLLESLEAALWTPSFRAAPKRQVVIFSDLLQHTSTLSHLKGKLPDVCAVALMPAALRLKPHMERTTVVLHYLINPKYRDRQGMAHLRWWAELFYVLGATAVYDAERQIAPPPNTCGVACTDGAHTRRQTQAATGMSADIDDSVHTKRK